MDPFAYNCAAWNAQAAKGNRWSQPVDAATIAAARRGDWRIVLTPERPVPHGWFGALAGADVLCLASGGGQQAPVLAAAGARVTSYDASTTQLAGDRAVADREGLDLRTIEGDMRDLGVLPDASFDLVFHPVSNCFVPDVRPVWRECARVLRPGGRLLAGFYKPETMIFDDATAEKGELVVRHALPYSDLTHLRPEELAAFRADDAPLIWSHSLEDQLGGQLAAGLVLSDLYEDGWPEHATGKYFQPFLATLAVKPRP